MVASRVLAPSAREPEMNQGEVRMSQWYKHGACSFLRSYSMTGDAERRLHAACRPDSGQTRFSNRSRSERGPSLSPKGSRSHGDDTRRGELLDEFDALSGEKRGRIDHVQFHLPMNMAGVAQDQRQLRAPQDDTLGTPGKHRVEHGAELAGAELARKVRLDAGSVALVEAGFGSF